MGSSHGDTWLPDYGTLFQIIQEILIVTYRSFKRGLKELDLAMQVYSPFRNLT